MPNEQTESQSDVQLLPCPWCQSSCLHLQNIETRWFVGCHDLLCLADGPCRPTKFEAITAWNTRAIPRDPQGLVEALRELLHAEMGFAEAVRHHTSTAYPWPALDIAEAKARAALAAWESGQ